MKIKMFGDITLRGITNRLAGRSRIRNEGINYEYAIQLLERLEGVKIFDGNINGSERYIEYSSKDPEFKEPTPEKVRLLLQKTFQPEVIGDPHEYSQPFAVTRTTGAYQVFEGNGKERHYIDLFSIEMVHRGHRGAIVDPPSTKTTKKITIDFLVDKKA